MKKISKRLLSVFLVIAMLIPTGLLTVTSSADDSIAEIYFEVKKGSMESAVMKFNSSRFELFISMKSGDSESVPVYPSLDNPIYRMVLTVFSGSELKTEFTGLSGDFEYYLRFTIGDTIYYDEGTISSGGNVTVTHKFSEKSVTDSGNDNNFQFPAGYDFETDRYGFGNYTTTIDKDIYIKAFGTVKGRQIYNKYKNYELSKHGVCFGMAATTGVLLEHRDMIKRSYNYFGDVEQNINTITTLTTFADFNGLDLDTYIRYAHIYQCSEDYISEIESNKNNITKLLNAVKNFVKTGNNPVVIEFREKEGLPLHSVLVIGYEENENSIKIITNDSNVPTEKQVLEWDKNTHYWSYCGSYDTNKKLFTTNEHEFSYTLSTDFIHQLGIEIGKTRKSRNIEEKKALYSKDALLISSSGTVECEEPLIGIKGFANGNINSDDAANEELYWAKKESKPLSITALETNSVVSVSDSNSSVSIVLDLNENASFYVDDDTANEVTYSSKNNENANIVFTSVDEKGEIVTTTLTGTANGNEVTATETENGIQMTGLNDITITYETADGTAETKADVKDGSTVNIIVNDDENTVETDWQSKQPDSDETDSPCKHPDTNHDGICDSCGQDFTVDCGHSCHSDNTFVQFFYKIARFFWKLFGMQNKRICACGQAHW